MTRALKHPSRIAETPEAARKLRTAQPSDAAQASPALLLQASLQDSLAVREAPRFPGALRLTIIVGGAVACWAAVLGSAGLILAL